MTYLRFIDTIRQVELILTVLEIFKNFVNFFGPAVLTNGNLNRVKDMLARYTRLSSLYFIILQLSFDLYFFIFILCCTVDVNKIR